MPDPVAAPPVVPLPPITRHAPDAPLLFVALASYCRTTALFDATERLLPVPVTIWLAYVVSALALFAKVSTDVDPLCRYTLEARNSTFVCDEFLSLLREHNIAWCIAESAGRYPYHEELTASFAYVRLHGRTELYASSYADEELRELAAKILSWSRDTYVYFDNDFSGYAVKNAMTLSSMLHGLNS